MSDLSSYVLQRSFDASRERLWSAWTEAEVACFTESIGGMGKGWEMGMDLLAKLLRDTPP